MIGGLAYSVAVAGMALACWAGLWAGRRRPVNAGQVVMALLVELSLVAQSGIAVVRIIGSATVAEPVTFIAYSVGVLAPLPLGIYVARIERTRWGSIGLAFTAVVVAVMTLRLLELWRTGGSVG